VEATDWQHASPQKSVGTGRVATPDFAKASSRHAEATGFHGGLQVQGDQC